MGLGLDAGPIEPRTERGKKICKILAICIWIQLAIAVVRLALLRDIFGSIFEALAALILYLGYSRCDFCSMLFYIFYDLVHMIYDGIALFMIMYSETPLSK